MDVVQGAHRVQVCEAEGYPDGVEAQQLNSAGHRLKILGEPSDRGDRVVLNPEAVHHGAAMFEAKPCHPAAGAPSERLCLADQQLTFLSWCGSKALLVWLAMVRQLLLGAVCRYAQCWPAACPSKPLHDRRGAGGAKEVSGCTVLEQMKEAEERKIGPTHPFKSMGTPSTPAGQHKGLCGWRACKCCCQAGAAAKQLLQTQHIW